MSVIFKTLFGGKHWQTKVALFLSILLVLVERTHAKLWWERQKSTPEWQEFQAQQEKEEREALLSRESLKEWEHRKMERKR